MDENFWDLPWKFVTPKMAITSRLLIDWSPQAEIPKRDTGKFDNMKQKQKMLHVTNIYMYTLITHETHVFHTNDYSSIQITSVSPQFRHSYTTHLSMWQCEWWSPDHVTELLLNLVQRGVSGGIFFRKKKKTTWKLVDEHKSLLRSYDKCWERD